MPDPVDVPTEFDVIVIGAGSTGENIAGPVGHGGLSCAVVESNLAGGECSYYACIPSKYLLRPLEVRAAAVATPGLTEPSLDVEAVLRGRDDEVNHWQDKSQVRWIEDQPGAVLFRGEGTVTGPKQVRVQTSDGPVDLTARHAVVIATGTDPAVPPIDGIDEISVWTNREALSAPTIPGRLAVIGGGAVAVEIAQAMSGLGAQVTLLVREHAVLTRLESFAGEAVLEQFAKDGIDVRLGVEVTRVEAVGTEGGARLHLGGDQAGAVPEVDRVLVGTGRTPRTAGLGLGPFGVADGKTIEVDDLLTVATDEADWLYAVGDVNGRNLLTHMGKYQARIASQVILARAKGETPDAAGAFADALGAPQVTFTNPQCGSIGLTEAQARDAGTDVRVVSVGFNSVAASGLQGWKGQGTAQLVIDQTRDVVIGATFVGADVAELVHAATIAVVGEVTLDRLWHTVPSFPTISEIWLRLLEKDRS